LKLTTDKHEASRGLFVTAELFVIYPTSGGRDTSKFQRSPNISKRYGGYCVI